MSSLGPPLVVSSVVEELEASVVVSMTPLVVVVVEDVLGSSVVEVEAVEVEPVEEVEVGSPVGLFEVESLALPEPLAEVVGPSLALPEPSLVAVAEVEPEEFEAPIVAEAVLATSSPQPPARKRTAHARQVEARE